MSGGKFGFRQERGQINMEVPCWFPDELAHACDEHLDPDYELVYDRKAGADPTEDVALLRNLGLNNTHTLVDFGTGTGTLALAAAPLCRRVVAVDVCYDAYRP